VILTREMIVINGIARPVSSSQCQLGVGGNFSICGVAA
jgi:hypothetical protein